jgi:dTDP-4-amino-4,6-dideoxygalactose transaminase
MSNVVAGIGRGQLKHLDEHIALKRDIYRTYKKAFEDIDAIRMNPYPECSEPNFWLSCMTIDEACGVRPLDVMLALEKENIESRPIWKPMHMQPVYKDADMICAGDKCVSEKIFATGLCLPSDIKNTPEDMDRIISIIRRLFEKA